MCAWLCCFVFGIVRCVWIWLLNKRPENGVFVNAFWIMYMDAIETYSTFKNILSTRIAYTIQYTYIYSMCNGCDGWWYVRVHIKNIQYGITLTGCAIFFWLMPLLIMNDGIFHCILDPQPNFRHNIVQTQNTNNKRNRTTNCTIKNCCAWIIMYVCVCVCVCWG